MGKNDLEECLAPLSPAERRDAQIILDFFKEEERKLRKKQREAWKRYKEQEGLNQ